MLNEKNAFTASVESESWTQQDFAEQFVEKLETIRGVSLEEATAEDHYAALSTLVKERLTQLWMESNRLGKTKNKKQVYYFSLEFLLGKMLEQNIFSLGWQDVCQKAMGDLKIDLEKVYQIENDPGLGNGGLGRLAACFMDSLAFSGLPGHGCSIRYRHGLFEQKIVDGSQIEVADNWLRNENVWEIKKPSKAVTVNYFGTVREEPAEDGGLDYFHDNCEPVVAMPYDIPMAGGENGLVNNLRLWSAESVRQFNFESFSSGDYLNAVSDKYNVEAISEILYPDDSNEKNRFLRLKQQYFFVSAGLQSIIRRYKKEYGDLRQLPEHVSVHINDTHPALAIPELMRILMDEGRLEWEEAWDITVHTVSYTNHTVMPEALERWPVDIFQSLLPRIYMITHEINERFCQELWQRFPGDWDRVTRMAIEAEGEIRMAFLAIVGSCSVNGVAKIHSEILKEKLFKDFYEIYPERFRNITNGVTQRRWIQKANPALTTLITDAIGPDWLAHPTELNQLDEKGMTRDPAFFEQLRRIKRDNKVRLAKIVEAGKKTVIDPDSIFDIQVKRFHAYKRQVLMALYVLSLYYEILDHPEVDRQPHTFFFGGKAAPGYYFAKESIRFISAIANRVNHDPKIHNLIKVVFLENYRVSLAESIFPAADVSEQISTAGKEASGTGNMKFMFNGAVTVGTMDGANIEIFEAAGEGNYVTFGLTAPEVFALHRDQSYHSRDYYENDLRIKRVFDEFINTRPGDVGKAEFPAIYDSLITYGDEFLVLKDYDSYAAAQGEISRLYSDQERWGHMSAMNIAHAGRFSSDEVVRKYAREIWNI